LQPIMMEGHGIELRSNRAERVEIPISDTPPVGKLRAQAEYTAGPSQQVALVDAEQAVQAMKRRQCDRIESAIRLPRRLNQTHATKRRFQQTRKCGRSQPPRYAAAHYHDA